MPDDTAPAPPPRFHRLRDRIAGQPAQTALRRDLPAPLVPVLRHWITLASQHDDEVAQRVGLRLDIPPTPLDRAGHSFVAALNTVDETDLLDVIDAILAVHRAPDWFHSERVQTAENYTKLVLGLLDTLEDAGSAFTVAANGRRLVERVDPTVAAAVGQTLEVSAWSRLDSPGISRTETSRLPGAWWCACRPVETGPAVRVTR